MKKLLTPQVRTFIYGATAALLSVATVQGWITQDLSKAIETSLPTIIGAIATVIAAANVKAPTAPAAAPAVPVRISDTVAFIPDKLSAETTHVPQAAAIEIPI